MGSKSSMVLGTRKGLLTLTRRDSGWGTEDTGFLGVPVSYAVTDPRSGMLWACLDTDHWGIFRSEDSRITWESVSEKNGPAHFGFALAMDEVDPNTAWVVPAISDEMRVPVKGALGVSRTENAGKTWQSFREGLPQEDCYDYAYRYARDVKGDQLVFGTTSGNVFFSQDRGESWERLGTKYPLIYSVRFDRTKQLPPHLLYYKTVRLIENIQEIS